MIKTIRGFMKRLNEDHVGAYAAQSAYFILLSFIPFVLLVVTLVKYTPLTRDDAYSVLINMLPTEFQSYVGGIVNEIFRCLYADYDHHNAVVGGKGHCGADKRAEQHLSRNRDT